MSWWESVESVESVETVESVESVGVQGVAGRSGALHAGLLRTQEALQSVASVAAPAWTPPRPFPNSVAADELPQPDNVDDLYFRSAGVRQKIVLADLLSHVEYGPTAGATIGIALKGRGASAPFVQMVRPHRTAFEAQAAMVRDVWAPLRPQRLAEITSQMGPQTPYWAAICNLHPAYTPRTLELYDLALQFSSFVVQRVKHRLMCPRPMEYCSQIQPVILSPAFSALPSGHATQAFLVARLLQMVMGQDVASELDRQLQAQADRIATNRVVAGVHFPVDSIAGRMLGQCLAEYLRSAAGGAACTARVFDGRRLTGDEAFAYEEAMDGEQASGPFEPNRAAQSVVGAPQHALLAEIWRRAAAEWTR